MVEDLGQFCIKEAVWKTKWLPSNVLKYVMIKRDKVYSVKSPGIGMW